MSFNQEGNCERLADTRKWFCHQLMLMLVLCCLVFPVGLSVIIENNNNHKKKKTTKETKKGQTKQPQEPQKQPKATNQTEPNIQKTNRQNYKELSLNLVDHASRLGQCHCHYFITNILRDLKIRGDWTWLSIQASSGDVQQKNDKSKRPSDMRTFNYQSPILSEGFIKYFTCGCLVLNTKFSSVKLFAITWGSDSHLGDSWVRQELWPQLWRRVTSQSRAHAPRNPPRSSA